MINKELLIIRHARSEHNARITGFLDSSLTEFGRHQAKTVGKFLSDQKELQGWSIYTSPFKRCIETTQEILENYKTDSNYITIDARLGECLLDINSSILVDMPESTLYRGLVWYGNIDLLSKVNYSKKLFKHENHQDYLQRMREAYDSIPNKSIIITHGLNVEVLRQECLHTLNHVPLWNYGIDNCSMTWIKNGRTIWWGRNLHYE